MAEDLRSLVEQLKAVANPLRLRVLALLGGGEICVCQVAETLGMPASSVSEALRELRRNGLVAERREGRWVYVSIPQERFPLLAALLAAAQDLPEARQDRVRLAEVKGLPVQAVCQRQRQDAPELSHV
jgi:ArsR family transcriptional regulator, arsenate/arsenite/antimonite-responsive transcriptional repressor